MTDDLVSKIEELERELEIRGGVIELHRMRVAGLEEATDIAIQINNDQVGQIEELERQRDAAFAMSRCECESEEACRNLAALHQKVEELERQRDELLADAERLDWIHRALFQKWWNGVVGEGSRTYWRIAGDYRHTVSDMEGAEFRAAIDAAIAAARKEQK